jgi:hypothetical protein
MGDKERLVSLRRAAALGLVALAFTASACGGGNESGGEGSAGANGEAGAAPDPGDCTADVDHALVPLSSIRQKIFQGSEKNPETGETILTRSEQRVLDESETIADYPVTAVESSGFEDGELVEKTVAYYTQCGDGSVWFVGEKLDEIEDGEVAASEEWEAGQDGAEAGLLMPADPKVGETFEPERVPGVSEARAKVVEVGVAVRIAAGRFNDCIKTEDFSPLDDVTELKFHCPRVGTVREQAEGLNFDLLRYQ